MDKDIIKLIKILRDKNRSDISDLLTGCKSETKETDQYGSYLNKFLSEFNIYTPTKNYQKLENLSELDRNLILNSILEIYPKSEDLEIRYVNFKLLKNEEDIEKNKNLAESWLKRALNKLEEGKNSVKDSRYSEAISSFQECIELSIKAMFLLLIEEHPKKHGFSEKEFKKILDRIPESLKNFEFHKLYLYQMFWQSFYTIAKYGLENFRIGPDKLFDKEEAEIALKHADKCRFAISQLKNYFDHPW